MKYSSSEHESEKIGGKKIDWNDYNFPCCVHIFHFDPDETPEPLVNKVRLLRLNYMLIVFVCLWNFVNNIVGTAQGYLCVDAGWTKEY